MKFDQGEDRTIGMAFATAAIPISGWWEASHTVQEHRLKEQMAKNDLQDRTELLQLQIEKAWQDLNDAYKQVWLCEEAKITAEVCSGRIRPKLNHGSMFRSGKASCRATTTPTRKPTMPQNIVAMAP